jgi:urea transporter
LFKGIRTGCCCWICNWRCNCTGYGCKCQPNIRWTVGLQVKSCWFAYLPVFSAVLGSMATCGMFYVLSPTTVIISAMCAIVCTILQGTMQTVVAVWGVPTLTFPFCLGTLSFVLSKKHVIFTLLILSQCKARYLLLYIFQSQR